MLKVQKLMADRTGLGTTRLHYLAVWQAMASTHRTIHSKIMLTYWLTWQTECFTPLSRSSGSPFPGFTQVFFALIVQIKLSEWAVTKTQLTCTRTVDYPTTSMGTSAIHLCSIKSSLPSLYPLCHSRDKSGPLLLFHTATESWAGPGNEANHPYLNMQIQSGKAWEIVTFCEVMYLEVDRRETQGWSDNYYVLINQRCLNVTILRPRTLL